MSFTNPDVYIQDVSSGTSPITQPSSTIGVMIGTTRSGKIGEAQLVKSFTEFNQLYANGLDTSFTTNSDLPYAVHGFFTNGGKELYVIRVASNTSKKSKATLADNLGITFEAKYEGKAGDLITVDIVESKDFEAEDNEVFDVTITVGTSDKTIIKEVTAETIVNSINTNLKASEWLVAEGELTKLVEEKITLTGGDDGITDLTDEDYIKALEVLDTVYDATFVTIPGQTSEYLNATLLAYCDTNQLFPILDMPLGSTVKDTKNYRKTIEAYGGALAYPWGRMTDPLTNEQRLTPSSGHLMGVYARTIATRGVHKAPAGVEAVVRGFNSMEKQLTTSDISELNPVGVVCIVSRPNAGIVVWGARGLNNDHSMKYVSDVLLNYHIKKSLYNNTQFAIFEPQDTNLWSKVSAVCEGILETLRREGALKGNSKEAYYVKVDETINTEATIENGLLNIEIGYSPVKPAEYVVIQLAHTMASA